MSKYKAEISRAVQLIERSPFWSKAQKDEKPEDPSLGVHVDEAISAWKLESILRSSLDQIGPETGKRSLALYYIVRDDDPEKADDMMIDQKIKEVLLGDTNEICWGQLLGKAPCVKLLKRGLKILQ
jgi:hypothetical protein